MDVRRFDARLERLVRMEKANAPRCILATEARLVFEASCGGRWPAVWALFACAVREDAYWTFYAPLRRFLCRWVGICYRDDTGRCLVCENTIDEEKEIGVP
jgi:hypothetical protein